MLTFPQVLCVYLAIRILMSMIDMGPIEYLMSFWRIIELFAIGAGIAAQFIYMSQRSYTGTYLIDSIKNISSPVTISAQRYRIKRSCLDETKQRTISRAHQIGPSKLVRDSLN